MKRLVLVTLACLSLSGCDTSDEGRHTNEDRPEPYASRYSPLPSEPVLLSGATVLTGTGERIDDADLLMRDGKIAAVGRDVEAGDIERIDASGLWITPGIIDVHSHLGVYPSPSVEAHGDGNEISSPNTAEVWAEHSVWPQDPGFVTALAGGVTALQVLPGSANLFGGRSVTLKNVPGRTVQSMKFPGAPYGLKMACGENPKRVYGGQGQFPSTRMGNVAGYRKAWIAAAEYLEKLESNENHEGGDDAEGVAEPARDLQLETLAGVLKGEILVHNHCYRADEMAIMIDIAREFDYEITAFHHAVEAYKIADLLAENGICAAVWADWWGFKMEAYDGIRENAALVHDAGVCTIVHSDDDYGIQRLNQEAGKIIGAAARAGMDIPPEQAIRWITSNPAKALGIADVVGTLEPGKMADVAVWDGSPFSVYSRVERVYIDGALVFERGNPDVNPVTDFTLGTTAMHGGAK